MAKHNEPVAWRYRSRGGEWFFTSSEALRDKVEKWGYELETLYSSPQQDRLDDLEKLIADDREGKYNATGVIQLLKEDSK